ncbi:uroporphyrinogen-III C-methyltransferase [Alloalcanivorax mobilis]|uniref:uroporphyrinogen-III C-methyltransferase n=1 Tax=Alloalcanivorax mobilis TaxID=2019569 RepID=UPI000C76E0B0|nr:uroporphyrinogen-III C-methyltransferase [Alloalcanivorax mobilis]
MTPQSHLSRQRGVSLWPILIVIIVVAALAVAGWWGWQQWLRLESDRAGLSREVSSLRETLEDQQRRQASAMATLRDQQDRFEASLAEGRAAMTDMKQGGQRLWLINEAESLASLASQRLLLTGDAAAARRLLKAADDTLARLDDPQALPARRALAVDMEKLSGALQVDVQAMVLRLGALQALVPELAVPARANPPQSDSGAEGQGAPSWWHRILGHLPVNVRHYDDKVPLPLTDTQASLVRLTLDASLQQAQLALMQGRADAYEQALAQVRGTLTQWFPADQGRVRQMRSAIDELNSSDVRQALPEIGAGLAAVRELKRKEAGQ